jgi:fatty-acyl-CoA synthase
MEGLLKTIIRQFHSSLIIRLKPPSDQTLRYENRMTASHNPYALHLDQNAANFVPLTPLTFIERAASVYPYTISPWCMARFGATGPKLTPAADGWLRRCNGAASAWGIPWRRCCPTFRRCSNCTFGVPMTGAVLNTLNIRLDAETIAFMLEHGEAKVLITDREFSETIGKALRLMEPAKRPLVIDVDDPQFVGGREAGALDYESVAG